MPFPTSGFVLKIIRERVEQRGTGAGARHRTVGSYECYMNNVRLSASILSGATAEPRGQGDKPLNVASDTCRVNAGTYPLGTHAGPRYTTFGYSTGAKRPALHVRDAKQQNLVLIQPGHGFRSGAGCINLTDSLVSPLDDVSSSISQDRLDTLIKYLKTSLDTRFPASGAQVIEDAWLVIEGSPV